MKNNINKITLIIDKCSNLIYTYIKNKLNYKFILFINKFIYKLYSINKKFLNIETIYKKFLYQFNNILKKILKFLNVTNSITIIVNRIRYPSYIKDNKIIIRLGNMKNIVIYLPHIKKSVINISEKGNLINMYSKDLYYITNLASLIKNCKKLDVCTGIGMRYEKEKIIFKRKIINDVKK